MTLIPLLMMTLVGCDEPAGEEHETTTPATTPATTPTASEKPRDDARAVPATTENIPAPADVAAPPADASKTESGLAYKVLSAGTGDEQPTELSTVEVHYTGWTTDGEMFDSSVVRGRTTKFPLNRVIAGWTEGLQLMKRGEKTRFWIPEELAYKGRPGAPAGMLVFDVELLEIVAAPTRPVTPTMKKKELHLETK